MQAGKLNVVVDAFWGSSGKGKLCSFLARQFPVQNLSASNMPNAGHTVQDGGRKIVFKVLPSGVATRPEASVWLCPGSVFNWEKLHQELCEAQHRGFLMVHERAALLRDGDKEAEQKIESITKIASTGQGCSVAMARKRNRVPSAVAGYDPEPALIGKGDVIYPSAWQELAEAQFRFGRTWLHEVSQGWALSIDWGTHYPECTSRNCDVQSALSEVGVSPNKLGDVYLNVRTYPIRVGNTAEGNSGGWWWDQTEVDWTHVAKVSGLSEDDLRAREMTTVTKRLRRVATFSYDLVKRAALHNGATKIFINFAQYITSECAGMRGSSPSILPKSVRVFCDSVENATGVPVVGVGTGPDVADLVWWA